MGALVGLSKGEAASSSPHSWCRTGGAPCCSLCRTGSWVWRCRSALRQLRCRIHTGPIDGDEVPSTTGGGSASRGAATALPHRHASPLIRAGLCHRLLLCCWRAVSGLHQVPEASSSRVHVDQVKRRAHQEKDNTTVSSRKLPRGPRRDRNTYSWIIQKQQPEWVRLAPGPTWTSASAPTNPSNDCYLLTPVCQNLVRFAVTLKVLPQ